MKHAYLLLLCFAASAVAQISRNPGDFDRLKVFDRISVELVPSETPKVEIKGSRASDVIIANKNGELKIAMPPSKLLDGEEIQAIVYYSRLKAIDATEGSFIASSKVVSADRLELNAKEGGHIKLELDVIRLSTRAVTGGKAELSGKAENNDISIGTGGSVKAATLATETTNVDINAGGSADIAATEKVKARTKAGGDVRIHGKPKLLDQNSVLGGSIKIVGENAQ